jgi:hypothetical protein
MYSITVQTRSSPSISRLYQSRSFQSMLYCYKAIVFVNLWCIRNFTRSSSSYFRSYALHCRSSPEESYTTNITLTFRLHHKTSK